MYNLFDTSKSWELFLEKVQSCVTQGIISTRIARVGNILKVGGSRFISSIAVGQNPNLWHCELFFNWFLTLAMNYKIWEIWLICLAMPNHYAQC